MDHHPFNMYVTIRETDSPPDQRHLQVTAVCNERHHVFETPSFPKTASPVPYLAEVFERLVESIDAQKPHMQPKP